MTKHLSQSDRILIEKYLDDDMSIENSLINLNVKKEIVIEQQEEVSLIYLYPYYKAELAIAQRLIELKNADNMKEIKKLKQELKRLEKQSK